MIDVQSNDCPSSPRQTPSRRRNLTAAIVTKNYSYITLADHAGYGCMTHWQPSYLPGVLVDINAGKLNDLVTILVQLSSLVLVENN